MPGSYGKFPDFKRQQDSARVRRVPRTYRLWSLRLLSCGKIVRATLIIEICERNGPVERCGFPGGWLPHQADERISWHARTRSLFWSELQMVELLPLSAIATRLVSELTLP